MNFNFDEKELSPEWTVESLNARLKTLVVGEVLRIEGLPNEIYHASEGISTSKIKIFIDCPYKYYCAFVAKTTEFKHQSYFDFGDAGHTTVLEPDLFESRYVRQSDEVKVRRGKKWEEFQEANEGKLILTAEQFDAMPKLRKAIDINKDALTFTTGGTAEVSYYRIDPETGLITKCRNDYERETKRGLVISDLKTSATADPRFMDSKFKKLGYHIQVAVYLDVTGAEGFVFVVVESAEPYVVTAPVVMGEDLQRLGYLKYRKAMRDIKRCMETGVWPMYVDGAHVIKPNKFDLDELEKLEGEL